MGDRELELWLGFGVCVCEGDDLNSEYKFKKRVEPTWVRKAFVIRELRWGGVIGECFGT